MKLMTPVYIKTEKDFPWPDDKLFYLLASDGLFICRNHEWFRSCVPATQGPGELEPQQTFSEFRFPKIPRLLMEKAIGFFRLIETTRHWESALILVWNRQSKEIELLCPDQQASGACVKYEVPVLPPHLTYMGDLHSHCNFDAFASGTDKDDEEHRPGLHIIVGRLYQKFPDFYCAGIVDSERFDIDNPNAVIEEFEQIQFTEEAPQEWVDKVKQHKWTWNSTDFKSPPNRRDKKKVAKVLTKFLGRTERPAMEEVRSEIWNAAFSASWGWCNDKAAEFIKENWGDQNATPVQSNIPTFCP